MEPENYKPKINERNQRFAQEIREYAKNYSILGIVDVTGLPAPQLQKIRATVTKKGAKVLIVKKNLIELVFSELEKTHKGVSELIPKGDGVIGLIFTNNNPFAMYKMTKKNKSTAPAKAGQVAPKDIVVPAGPTGFSPGPIIGELGAFKIKAGINAGKVEIKEDATVAREGDEISEKLAEILGRLQVEPMEVGLNIKAMYEEGTIYTREVLDVDEDEILGDLRNEAARSAALAYGIGYVTPENITQFLTEASRDSFALALGSEYPLPETIKELLTKANSQGVGFAVTLPEDVRPEGLAAAAAQPSAGDAPVAEDNSASANEESNSEEKKDESEVNSGFGGFF